ELRWCYAENRVGELVQLHCASDYVGITVEVTLPVGVTEHDVRAAVGAVLIGAMEEAAKIRANSQCVKIISARLIEPGTRGFPTCVQACASHRVRHNTVDAVVSVAQL